MCQHASPPRCGRARCDRIHRHCPVFKHQLQKSCFFFVRVAPLLGSVVAVLWLHWLADSMSCSAVLYRSQWMWRKSQLVYKNIHSSMTHSSAFIKIIFLLNHKPWFHKLSCMHILKYGIRAKLYGNDNIWVLHLKNKVFTIGWGGFYLSKKSWCTKWVLETSLLNNIWLSI